MSQVQTLARGLQILDLLAIAEDGLSTTELATKLAIDKSSMSRLLHTLVEYHYAERNEQTKRYYLGAYVQEIGRQAGQYASLRKLTDPYLQRLSTETGENAHVSIYSGKHAVTIADMPSTEPLRVVSEVGRHVPMHCSAIGKCLLAFNELPLPIEYARYTERTILSANQLALNLEQIRLQGYAVDDEELTLGVRGIAAPIRNREGRAIATMGISGPSVRVTLDAIATLASRLVNTADEVSKLLGYIKSSESSV